MPILISLRRHFLSSCVAAAQRNSWRTHVFPLPLNIAIVVASDYERKEAIVATDALMQYYNSFCATLGIPRKKSTLFLDYYN